MTSKPNGVVIYRGPSELDGKPIVVIATGLAKASSNSKTGGDLIQTWILREDLSPTEAVNSGADESICGDCIHRGQIVDGKNVGRSCYVTIFQAPLNVWKSFHRGIYPTAIDLASTFEGRAIRLGSYGDPAAVPAEVWEEVTRHATFWTGYTHQWRKVPVIFAQWCMASADTPQDQAFANAMGYRTFRVRSLADPVLAGEVICPASEEAGRKVTCSLCKACGGNGAKAKANIVIAAHGAASKVNAFARRAA